MRSSGNPGKSEPGKPSFIRTCRAGFVISLSVPVTADHSNSPHPALGIDHGDARIGIAATDDFGILAHPVETIDRAKTEPVSRIAELAERRKIHTLVLGLPVRMDGSEGDSAAKVRAFAGLLRERIPDIPLVFVDESLTTSAASAKLREAGRKARQQKAVIDQAAAVEILNTWMGDSSPPQWGGL